MTNAIQRFPVTKEDAVLTNKLLDGVFLRNQSEVTAAIISKLNRIQSNSDLDLETIKKELLAIRKVVAEQQQNVTDLSTAVELSTDDILENKQSIEDLSENVEKNTSKIVKLDKAISEVSIKLNDFLYGSDTDGIINKWKELEKFLKDQTELDTLAELLDVKADIADVYTKDVIDDKHAELQHNIQQINNGLSNNQKAVELLKTDVIDNKNNIKGNADAIEECRDDILKLDQTKADKAKTLAGYGIEDAYTKEDVDRSIGEINSSLDDVDDTFGEINVALDKVNQSIEDIVDLIDSIESGSPFWDNILDKPEFSDVAFSGDYFDIINIPGLVDFVGVQPIGGDKSFVYWTGLNFKAVTLGDNAFSNFTKLSQLENDLQLETIYVKIGDSVEVAEFASTAEKDGDGNVISETYATSNAVGLMEDRVAALENDTVLWEEIQDKPSFANVAFSGDYNDLINVPTIPDSGTGDTPDLGEVLEWFTLDRETETLTTKWNLASNKTVSSLGVGTDDSGEIIVGAQALYELNDVASNGDNVAGAVEGNALVFTNGKWQGGNVKVDLSDIESSIRNHESRISANESDIEDLKNAAKYFTLELDENGNYYLHTTYSLASDETVSSLGVGTDNDTESIGFSILQSWDDDSDTYEVMALGSNLGRELYDSISVIKDENLKGISSRVDNVESELDSVNQTLTQHGTSIQNNRVSISNIDERISPIEDFFNKIKTWFTLEGDVLRTTYSLASDKTVSSLGVDSDSGEGGISYDRLDSWDNYVEGSGAVLGADLGYGLLGRIEELEQGTSGDISEVSAKVEENTNAITALQGQLNTLVSGDASSAIESFNEVVAFLKDVEDDSTLEGILAGKQNRITEENKLDYSLIANTPSLADFMGNSSIGGTASSDNFSAVYWDGSVWKTRTIYKWALASVKPSYTTSEVTEGTRLYFTAQRAKDALKDTTDALSARIAVFEKMFQWGEGNGSHIKTPYAFASDSTVSSLGVGSDGTGGVSYDRLDSWDSYTDDKAGYVLSAALGWDLKTRLDNLDIGDFDLSGYLSKSEASDTYATIAALNSGLAGKQNTISDLATIREDSKKFGNSPASAITSANITNWNTAYSWGNHADKGYLVSSDLDGYVNEIATSGSGNAITSVTKSGKKLTFNKASSFFLAENFTKTNIKTTLGISDWALASSKPSYKTNEVAEEGNLYFTTDRVKNCLTGAISTVLTSDLTASRALMSNASGKIAVSAVTSTELGYLDGVTSAIQTQLNALSSRIKAYEDILKIEQNGTLLHATVALASDSTLSSLGVGSDEGGGAGTSVSILQDWGNYDENTVMALGANLGYELNERFEELGYAALMGYTTTVVSGDNQQLVTGDAVYKHVTSRLNPYALKSWVEDGYATKEFVTSQGYMDSDEVESFVTAYVTDNVQGKYLLLSGGTLYDTKSDTPLNIKGGGTAAYIGFQLSDGTKLGSIGVNDEKTPLFYSSDGTYKILHKGNTSYYPVLTSGTKIGTITIGGTATDLYAPVGVGDTSELEMQVSENSQLIAELTTGFNDLNENKQEKITATNKLAYSLISGTPTLGTAASKGVTTSVTNGSTDLVTSGGVYTKLSDYVLVDTFVELDNEVGSMASTVSAHEGKWYNLTTNTGLASGYIKQLKADTLDLGGSVVATTDDLDAFGNTIDNLFARKATTLAGYGITDNVFVPRTRITSDENADNLIENGIYLNATGNGSGNSNFPQLYSAFLNFYQSNSYRAQLSVGTSLWFRRKIDSWSSWRECLDSSNFSNYALPLSGGTMTGDIILPDNKFIRHNASNGYALLGVLGKEVFVGASINPLRLRSNGVSTINGNTLIHSGNIGSQSVGNATKWGGFKYYNEAVDNGNNAQYFKLVTIRIKGGYVNSVVSFDISGRSKGVAHIEVYPNGKSSISNNGASRVEVTGNSLFADKIRAYTIGNETDSSGNITAKVIEVWYTKQQQSYDSVVVQNVHWGQSESVEINCNIYASLPTSYESYVDATMGSIYGSITKLTTPHTIWGQSFDGTGNVSGALGLGGSAKIYWHSDADNYYINADYSIASNAPNLDYCAAKGHRFASGSVEIMRLLSNGNVLIGTTADSGQKLQVNGKTKLDDILTVNYSSATRATGIEIQSTNGGESSIGFKLSDTTRFVVGCWSDRFHIWRGVGAVSALIINNSGNVTIGSSDLATTNYKLYVNGGSYVNGELKVAGRSVFSSAMTCESNLYVNQSLTVSGNILPSSTDTQNLGSTSSYWKNLYVGIITGHYQSGDVVKFSGSINANEGNISCKSLTVNGSSLSTLITEAINTFSEENLGTAASYGVTTSVTSGSSSLVTSGGVASALSGYIPKNGGAVTGTLSIGSTRLNVGSTTLHGDVSLEYGALTITHGTIGSSYWSITNDGVATVKTLSQTSDETLKNLMGDVRLSLGTIACAPLKKFTFKDGDGEMYVGTIAQYWQGALPEVVTKTINGTLALSYGELGVAMGISLANILEDTNGRVATVEEEIKALKEENKRLKERVAELEAA